MALTNNMTSYIVDIKTFHKFGIEKHLKWSVIIELDVSLNQKENSGR